MVHHTYTQWFLSDGKVGVTSGYKLQHCINYLRIQNKWQKHVADKFRKMKRTNMLKVGSKDDRCVTIESNFTFVVPAIPSFHIQYLHGTGKHVVR